LLAQQDFPKVIELLQPVPPEYRSAEAGQLLKQAEELKAEADQLNERMQQAVREGQYDGLRENVLERLLDLEPGNLTARDIYEHLGTYGPGEKLLFDKNGMLLPAHGKYWWLDRLAHLMYQRMTRRQVRRGKAGARGQREPAPAKRKGDKSHFVGFHPALRFGERSWLLSRSPSWAQRERQAELLGCSLLPHLVSKRTAAPNRPAQCVQLAFRLHFVHQTNPIPRAHEWPVA
jgi:hypothetical protein